MIAKISPFKANIDAVAPPSKSYAHRLMIAAALGDKTVRIENVGNSDDVLATARCLSAIGAGVKISSGNAEIEGVFAKRVNLSATLDCGESGSTLRFLMPLASALGIKAEFKGRGKLLERPNEIAFDLLKAHGVTSVGYSLSGKLVSGVYEVNAGVSSQYITGLLFALPILEGDSKILLGGEVVSAGYIDVTLEVLSLANVKYKRDEMEITVYGNQRFSLPEKVVCEGDWSGAAALFTAGAISGRAKVGNLKPNSLQGDKKIAEIIVSAGGEITFGKKIVVGKGNIKGFKVNLENCPDLAPSACVLAAAAEGVSEISGLKRLRIKESDRFAAICDLLKNAGVKFEASEGEIKIFGGKINGGKFDGFCDHRIVMAATALAMIAQGDSEITCAEAVSKSYPDFFKNLNGGQNVRVER